MKNLLVLLITLVSIASNGQTLMDPSQAAIDSINSYRVSKNLSPVKMSKALNIAARHTAKRISRKMDKGEKLTASHHSSQKYLSRVTKSLYMENLIALSNVTFLPDPSTVSQANVSSWSKSNGHNKNMLRPVITKMGYGYFIAKNGTLIGVLIGSD